MKIYLAHPISGLSADDVFEYFTKVTSFLFNLGYQALSPMIGKEFLRTEKKFRTEYTHNPISTNSAIVNRDLWMVEQSDIVLMNFTRCKDVSIGMVAELTAAYLSRKMIISIIPEENPHRHAFIIQMSGTIFTNEDQAFEYLRILAEGLHVGSK